MDKHYWIVAVKTMAAELGRPPKRSEFMGAHRGADYQVVKLFGSWNNLMMAAEVETYDERRSGRKIDNSIFLRDVESQLEKYKPKSEILPAIERFQRVLFLGDTHHPFVNQRALEKVYLFAEREKPEVIVQVGDLYDVYSHAKFPRSHNVFTPRQEEELGRRGAETMWAELKKASPKARCVQLWGNHDVRPLKRVLEQYPAAEDWIAERMNQIMSFDGVETLPDSRQELILPGNVMVHHGYMGRPGAHRDYNAGFNFVFGHTHTAHVLYKQIQGQVRWEMNVGFLGDVGSKGLSYTPQKLVQWTVGHGWLDEDGPRFIPA